MDRGWGWPSNSKKAHYFIECRSLCMKWLYFGAVEEPKHVRDGAGPDDCRSCHKRLQKLQPARK